MFDASAHTARHRRRFQHVARYAALLSLILAAACTVVRPWSKPWTQGHPKTFSHADFDRVLKRFVNKQGLVDYAALKVSRDDLETYYKQLSFYSPESHPQLFVTDAHKLAYWINAYNAATIKTVLKYYPIHSVSDVSGPLPLNFIVPRSGFFLAHRILLGGDTFSLDSLEKRVVRASLEDPRVHFALNGAARGAPQLARAAFTGERLEEQLERAAKRFFAADRNLRVDHEAKTVFLSSLLKWHRGDFIGRLERTDPDSEASLLAYAELYAPLEKATDLAMAQGYEVELVDYDWRLNDSNAE